MGQVGGQVREGKGKIRAGAREGKDEVKGSWKSPRGRGCGQKGRGGEGQGREGIRQQNDALFGLTVDAMLQKKRFGVFD